MSFILLLLLLLLLFLLPDSVYMVPTLADTLPLFLYVRHRSESSRPVHTKLATCSLSERFGRKFTLYLLWCVLSVSIIIECVAKTWQVWLVAKLIAGMGVGTLRESISFWGGKGGGSSPSRRRTQSR